ncbi:MAG: CapA family protein [Ancrocorticia sp.]|nr:CapA family protein [Ancrocorticia sp.]MCI1895363.1 CapA family protein [Ancrocorticia sp.]MCI1932030.1 CapA family protein [Ancrocorticia sp.]MCI1963391.1 CapA family protein [Ancrocorticia sp.]MCI2002415.1 CapA family protein [Ancrocorticia sp.]
MRRRFTAALICVIAVSGCSTATSEQTPQATASLPASTTPVKSPSPTATASTITIVGSGDILPHLSVNDSAWDSQSGTFDYAALLAGVQPWISGADLALCAMEVPIAPAGEEPSNYPLFGARAELAASIKEVGWDGCHTATNHSMDRGFAGITATLDAFDSVGLGHAGTARTQQESDAVQYYTLETGGRDVVIAHLSATTLTNGLLIPEDHPYSWNVVGALGKRSIDDLIVDAARARANGADLVVLSMHWGTEYVSTPTAEQRTLGEQLAASKQFDLVFGTHSHVPEPVEKLEGGPDDRGMWVVWSMGNLISGQQTRNAGYKVMAGILATATVEVPASGPAHVSDLEWTVTAQDERTDHVFLLSDLVAGDTPEGMSLSPAEINALAEVTYPVMAVDGQTERTTAPTPAATLVSQERH